MGKTLCKKLIINISLFFFTLALLCGSIFYVLKNIENKTNVRTNLLFAGDILLSRKVQSEIEYRKESPWIYLDSLLSSSDLVVGNFEGAIGNNDENNKKPFNSPIFPVSPNYVHNLKEAGFDIMVTENNHSGDLFSKGRDSTIYHLKNNNLHYLNFENSPFFYNHNGNNLGFIAINLIKGQDSIIQAVPSIEVLQKIRKAKSLCNVVVVYIHWGNELNAWPNDSQKNAANWLTQNGVDLIIGSHPHVIQEPAMVNNKIVFYSLGNHLFDQKYVQTKFGLMANCNFIDDKLECNAIETIVKNGSFYPRINKAVDFNLGAVNLKRVDNDKILIIPKYIKDDTSNAIILEAFLNTVKLWETFPIRAASIELVNLKKTGNCIFALEKHYSPIDKEIGLRPYVYAYSNERFNTIWRGSALAYPILDATFLNQADPILCVLHRGDSFLQLNPNTKKTRVMAYNWNGFGFSGIVDTNICKPCKIHFATLYKI